MQFAMTKWISELRSLFPVDEEFELARAIYPFEASFCAGLTPQQAYERFDSHVACEDADALAHGGFA